MQKVKIKFEYFEIKRWKQYRTETTAQLSALHIGRPFRLDRFFDTLEGPFPFNLFFFLHMQ